MLKIPYGVSHFPSIIERGQVFIDRTGYIRLLEDSSDHVFFLRPRRFGKSLWLSILEHYYDVRFADRFAALFGGLDIGRAPTPLRNRFLVLKLDFSAVDTSGDDTVLRDSLLARIRNRCLTFLEMHAPWLKEIERVRQAMFAADGPNAVLEMALHLTETAGLPVYLLFDEYDNFTNELIAGRQEDRYKNLVTGTGLLKTFFKGVKEATQSGVVARTFITGVNPLLLDDLTSGFNIATNLSLEPGFAGMLGFAETEVRELLVRAASDAPASEPPLPSGEELADLARAWYNGYRFHPASTALYNPDMVLYLLKSLVQGRLPMELLDTNLRTDLGKLDLVVRKAGDFDRLWQLVADDRDVPGRPSSVFGLEKLAEPHNFLSLLFYLGMLTCAPGPEPALRVPNYVVRTLYWTQVQRLAQRELQLAGAEPVRQALRDMMRDGDAEPFFRLLLDQVIRAASNRDLIHFNEAGVKAIALAFLTLSDEIAMFSEWETGGGYADLVVVPQPTAHWLHRAWMIELKYLRKKDDTPAQRELLLAEGQQELRTYLADPRRMRYLSRYELRTAVALFVDADELVWQAGPVVAPG